MQIVFAQLTSQIGFTQIRMSAHAHDNHHPFERCLLKAATTERSSRNANVHRLCDRIERHWLDWNSRWFEREMIGWTSRVKFAHWTYAIVWAHSRGQTLEFASWLYFQPVGAYLGENFASYGHRTVAINARLSVKIFTVPLALKLNLMVSLHSCFVLWLSRISRIIDHKRARGRLCGLHTIDCWGLICFGKSWE